MRRDYKVYECDFCPAKSGEIERNTKFTEYFYVATVRLLHLCPACAEKNKAIFPNMKRLGAE